MKTYIKIFAVLLVILSVASCGKTEKSVEERIAQGEDIYVGLSIETATNPFYIAQAEYLRDAFGGIGVKLDYAVSEGDDLVMSGQIDAFAASNTELIICAPPHEDAVAKALTDAAAKGVEVVVMGRMPEYSDRLAGGTWFDWFEAGREMAKMASAWVSENYPNAAAGSIHAANFMSDSQDIFLAQTSGLVQGLADDPRISITYNRNDVHTVEAGAESAESALIYDPGIRLFFCYQDSGALGISGFVTSNADFDPTEYAAFSVGLQSTGRAAIEESKIDESIFRGAIAYGVYSESKQLTASECIFIVARDILFGKAPSSPWWMEMDRWAVTGFQYNYLYDSPANDELLRR